MNCSLSQYGLELTARIVRLESFCCSNGSLWSSSFFPACCFRKFAAECGNSDGAFTRAARSFLLTLWWFVDLPPLLRNELLDRCIELEWFKWLRHCQCLAQLSYLLPFLRCCAATDHHNWSVLECCDSADLLNELVPRSTGAEQISRNQVWMVG